MDTFLLYVVRYSHHFQSISLTHLQILKILLFFFTSSEANEQDGAKMTLSKHPQACKHLKVQTKLQTTTIRVQQQGRNNFFLRLRGNRLSHCSLLYLWCLWQNAIQIKSVADSLPDSGSTLRPFCVCLFCVLTHLLYYWVTQLHRLFLLFLSCRAI